MIRAGPPYKVLPYDRAQLGRIISEAAGANEASIADKLQTDYLVGYLDHLGARTLIIEGDYVDLDFLEDFADYYVQCFRYYPRRCVRLHFFARAFGAAQFTRLLAGNPTSLTPEDLNREYLGFT